MSGSVDMGWVRPDNRRLLVAVAVLQLLLIAVPALWSDRLVWMLSGQLIVLGLVLFSVERALLVLLLVNIVLPSQVLALLILPGGLRFQEGLFLVALVFALIDLVYRRDFRIYPSRADLPVLIFLGVTALSVGTGFLYHNMTTVIWRDARFPLYYAAFFLATNFVDKRSALRRFLPALVVAALIVSVEYVLEFVGAIDLSVGSRFVRVARLQGVVLPLALLFIANQFIHYPERYGRGLLIGLFAPISLAFVLTVGRGMWVGFGVGLITTVVLWHLNRPSERRRAWQAGLLIVGMVAAIGLTAFLFQRVTGSAIGAHALERSRTFLDLGRDVHVLGRLSSYVVTLGQIAEHPLLGSGQGATLSFFGFNEEFNRFELAESWTVDNIYLALLWKMGIVGLAVFGWMVLRLLRLAYGTFKRTRDPGVRAFAGGMVAMIVGMGALGMSDAAMLSGRFALVFALLFGLMATVARGEETE